MLVGRSKVELLFILASIALFRYLFFGCLFYLVLVGSIGGVAALIVPFSIFVETVAAIEVLFYFCFFLPYRSYLQKPAYTPPPLTRAERSNLYYKTMSYIPDFEAYLCRWMLDAPKEEIRRENVKDWLLWALFERQGHPGADEEELDEYITAAEEPLERTVLPGRGKSKPLKLTFDPVAVTYRSPFLYAGIGILDLITHLTLLQMGFSFYRQPRRNFFKTWPLRPLTLLSPNETPTCLSYFYRPHRSTTHRPVLFIHGAGIGLFFYLPLLRQLPKDVGIIAIEFLSVSGRITTSFPSPAAIVAAISSILWHHSFTDVVLLAHSFGTLLTAPCLSSPYIGPRISHIILLDPVSPLLHLPDVAYNFTRRRPQEANEWQMYYFVSTDPGTAYTLGRQFCWREYILWLEDLQDKRTTVIIGEKDCVSDADAISSYVYSGDVISVSSKDKELWAKTPQNWTGKRDLELIWLKGFDLGQVLLLPDGLREIKKVLAAYTSLS